MNSREVKERIEEYHRIRRKSGSDGAALAETALFVEEVFAVVLTDQEICPENLGSIAAMEQFVLNKLGLHS